MRRLALAALACTPFVASAQALDGKALFLRPEKGACIACHQVPEGAGPATRNDLGPKLEGARMRALGAAALRAEIFDPMRKNPDTLMPPYGRHRILDAGEIDRVVEYLLALP